MKKRDTKKERSLRTEDEFNKWFDETDLGSLPGNARPLPMNLSRKGDVPPHPGELIKVLFLQPRGMSQAHLAKELDCTPAKLNEIINGKRGVTPEFAIDLGRVMNVNPEILLTAQMKFDLWQAIRKKNSA